MDYKITQNAINRLPKGMIVFNEGETVQYIAMIIKGRVAIRSQGISITAGPGSFIGVNDLYTGRYKSIYEADDDIALYMYPVSKSEDLDAILSANSECNGYIVSSLNKLIYEYNIIFKEFTKEVSSLHQFLKDTYEKCMELSHHKMEFPQYLNKIMSCSPEDDGMDLPGNRINYYSECRNLPINAVKQYYSQSNTITLYEVDEQVNIIDRQMEKVKELAKNYVFLAECLLDKSDSCLFYVLNTLAEDEAFNLEKNNYLLDILDSIINEINQTAGFMKKMLGRELEIDRMRMEKLNHLLLTRNITAIKIQAGGKPYTEDEARQALDELKDSLDKLLNYAGIEGEKAEAMKKAMQDFIMMKDKMSIDDTARAIRRKVTESFYNLYKEVFIKAYKDSKVPRLIELFLKYGYTDERLLTEEQLLYFYFLPDDDRDIENFKVYDIVSWLTLIYEGKKEPSKNEFDLDYHEMLADMKRQGRLTEKEMLVWQSDADKKLEYEIKNMFKYNNRITNGQITTFVPVLHKEMLIGDMNRIRVTAAKIKASLDKLISIDYSAFDREVIYSNEEKNIKREYIIKKVYPDIILMPTVGVNGVMWQDITGKKRDTPGRFILPAFSEMDLDTMLAKVLGRFRWEICRTIKGAMWNDITKKSLTSEYTYYMQFYRKMRDLSEETKEKIKSQIQSRRNIREVFISDYLSWILYEATGAIKLTKPAREILATYCPLSRKIREQLKNQPIFEEAMRRYYAEKKKKIREIEGRYRMLEKESIEVTPELKETLAYYKES